LLFESSAFCTQIVGEHLNRLVLIGFRLSLNFEYFVQLNGDESLNN